LTNTTNGTLSQGGNGYNFCSGEAPTFTATYATSNSTATLLSNLVATINSCPAAAGVSAAANGTVTDTILGANSFGGSGYSSFFTWTVVSAGGAGSAGCTSTGPNYTATYATSSSTSTLASNLYSVIGTTCTSAVRTALGISASYTSGSSSLTITASTSGTTGDSITVTPTSGYFAWAAGNLTGGDGTTATPSSTTTFGYSGSISATQVAANIATAINNNTTLQASTGVTATSGTCNSTQGCVYVTARATGGSALSNSVTSFPDFSWVSSVAGTSGTSAVLPNTYPAKYSFVTSSASCSDFAIYPTGTSGSGVPSIVAYTNLYTGCSGAVPTVSWAYATGGTVTTSPLLSYWDNGLQVAFIQVSGTTASLVLIKWAAGGGTLTSPVTPTNSSSGSLYRSCTPTATTPCMFTIAFNGSHNDTYSTPFDDYGDDAIYVGDDSGYLHLFTGVFQGTPAEVYTNSGGCGSTCSWPVLLNSSNKVSSPVYAVTGGGDLVFVGDFGGYFYFVTGGVSGGAKTTTPQYGDVFADAPLVDAVHNLAYAFVTTGNSNTDTGYNIIAQFSFCCGVPSVDSGFLTLGTGATGHYLYAGAFDDMYFNNASAYAYGNIYVVGGTGAAGGGELYRIPVQENGMGTVTSVASVNSSSGYPWPSPVTELCCNANTGADLIFFSVNYPASGLGCTSGSGDGCILAYDVSNPSSITQAGSGLTVTTPGTNGCYATGGVIVDNVSDLTGASQIYFVGLNGANAAGVPTGSSGCTSGTAVTLATQASQASP
jgi:hypothetical protein